MGAESLRDSRCPVCVHEDAHTGFFCFLSFSSGQMDDPASPQKLVSLHRHFCFVILERDLFVDFLQDFLRLSEKMIHVACFLLAPTIWTHEVARRESPAH